MGLWGLPNPIHFSHVRLASRQLPACLQSQGPGHHRPSARVLTCSCCGPQVTAVLSVSISRPGCPGGEKLGQRLDSGCSSRSSGRRVPTLQAPRGELWAGPPSSGSVSGKRQGRGASHTKRGFPGVGGAQLGSLDNADQHQLSQPEPGPNGMLAEEDALQLGRVTGQGDAGPSQLRKWRWGRRLALGLPE